MYHETDRLAYRWTDGGGKGLHNEKEKNQGFWTWGWKRVREEKETEKRQ